MTSIFFGLPTFETVNCLIKDLSLSNNDEKQGMISTLFALKDLGLIYSDGRRRRSRVFHMDHLFRSGDRCGLP